MKPNKGLVIDLETSGLDANKDKIIEVCCLAFEGDKVLEIFTTLVDPLIQLPKSIVQHTNINSSMLVGFPLFSDISNKLMELWSTYQPWFSYNAPFEQRFLSANIKDIKWDIVDVMKPASAFCNSSKWLKLKEAAYILKLRPPTHRAIDDCLTTYQLINKMADYHGR